MYKYINSDLQKHLMLVMYFVYVGLSLLTLSSCGSEDEKPNTKAESKYSFQIAFAAEQTVANQGGRIMDNTPSQVLISLKNTNGDLLLNKEPINVYRLNERFVSPPIVLETGVFDLTEFIVVDSENNILYAAPIEGSMSADLTDQTLPLRVSLIDEAFDFLNVQVVSLSGASIEEFGYLSFGFEILETSSIKVTPIAYDQVNDDFLFVSDATLLLRTNELETLYDSLLIAGTNNIVIGISSSQYHLQISRPGFDRIDTTILETDLERLATEPLIINY